MYALRPGFVRYYIDPDWKGRKPRKWVGVALSRDDKLPTPKTEPRKRWAGLLEIKGKRLVGPNNNYIEFL